MALNHNELFSFEVMLRVTNLWAGFRVYGGTGVKVEGVRMQRV